MDDEQLLIAAMVSLSGYVEASSNQTLELFNCPQNAAAFAH
jgi:hypothetical protein